MEIEIKKNICVRCKKEAFLAYVGGPCRECHDLTIKFSAIQNELTRENEFRNKEDEALVKRIVIILNSKSTSIRVEDEKTLIELVNKLQDDNKKRSEVIPLLQKLQGIRRIS